MVSPASLAASTGSESACAVPHRAASGSGRSLPSAAELAAQAAPDRNRAIDLYRAIAMLAVALGHWLAIVAIRTDGDLEVGNALTHLPSMAWATWVLQVMPLFFIVGGFSSAMSLDSHQRNNGRPQDWVAARLRRMLPPAVALATTWLVVLGIAGAIWWLFGAAQVFELAAAGAWAAAIPLWFLANYTIDTALAPHVLPRLRRNPVGFSAMLLGSFGLLEAIRIFVDGPLSALVAINWVLGWLIFQVVGMAWRDGRLPKGRSLLFIAALLWFAAVALVHSGGPWEVSMVNAPGMEHSPTNPPNLALLLFGFAYGATAIAAAPVLSRWLAATPKAWTAVVASNSMAMTVYLWHMTAAVIVTAAIHLTVGLPQAAVGSGLWWLWKAPTMLASALVLAGLVRLVGAIERDALLAPRRPWNGSVASISAVAVLASLALKQWTSGSPMLIVPSLLVLVVLGHTVLSHRSGRFAHLPTPRRIEFRRRP
jgi:hypothetical protein